MELEKWQIELVTKEIDFVFDKVNGTLEKLDVQEDMFMITGLLHLSLNIKDTITDIVQECNQMGNFLMDSFIVTNVKKLEIEEIREMVQHAHKDNEDNLE